MSAPPTTYQVSTWDPDTMAHMQVHRTTDLAKLLRLAYQVGLRHQDLLVHATPTLRAGMHGWTPLIALEPQAKGATLPPGKEAPCY
jgi:hypothetical protein